MAEIDKAYIVMKKILVTSFKKKKVTKTVIESF